MKALQIFALVAITLLLAGCDPGLRQPSKASAQDVVNKLTYVKDKRTGLCFGVVFTVAPMDARQAGVSVTLVPCEAVESLIAP